MIGALPQSGTLREQRFGLRFGVKHFEIRNDGRRNLGKLTCHYVEWRMPIKLTSLKT